MERLPSISFLCGLYPADHRRQSRHPNQNGHFVGVLPTPFFVLDFWKSLPETVPRPCSIKHLVSCTLLDSSNGGEISPETAKFCSRIYFPRFLNRDIFNQVCGLAFQKGAQRFKVFPRYALLVSELLERRLAQ